MLSPKRLSLYLMAITIAAGFTSCQKDEIQNREYPMIETSDVTNITSEGATFTATITSGNPEMITEYGFVWGYTDNLTVDDNQKVIIDDELTGNSYSYEITFALVAMKDYFVRSYVKSGNFVIYGNPVVFKSLGSQTPVIENFEPKSATWGDTILITGQNFSFQDNSIRVYFGTNNAKVIQSSDRLVKAIVPDALKDRNTSIALEIIGNRSIADSSFHLITLGYIDNFSPLTATWDDTIQLNGYFPYNEHQISASINGLSCNLVEINTNSIKVLVPPTTYKDSVQVQLIVDNHSINSSRYLHMIKPRIDSFSPIKFGWDDTIQISGVFIPVKEYNIVSFGNKNATIISANGSSIICVVPLLNAYSCNLSIASAGYNIIYPNAIQLLTPIISSVSPAKVYPASKITINGKYFCPGSTQIRINSEYVSLVSCSTKKIELIIPYYSENGPAKITVINGNNEKDFSGLLTIADFRINSIDPSVCFFGDIVSINGENFEPSNISLYIRNNNLQLEIISATPTEIQFRVPDNYSSRWLDLVSNGRAKEFTGPDIYTPLIDEIIPSVAEPGEIIHFTGNNFNPQFEYNTVHFNYYSKTVAFDGDRNNIYVKVPSLLSGTYNDLSVANGLSGAGIQGFQCISPWQSHGWLFYSRTGYSSFVQDNKLYIIGGSGGQYGYFQVYNITTGATEQYQYVDYYSTMSDIVYGIAFSIGDYGYFGVGESGFSSYSKIFYKLDLNNNTWSALNDFPGNERKGAFCFSIGGKGYIGTGSNEGGSLKDVWEYIPETDSWKRLADFPGVNTLGAKAIVYNGKAYIISGNEVWLYNPENDQYTQKQAFPGISRYHALIVSTSEGIYYGTGENIFYTTYNADLYSDLWFYSFSQNTWERIIDFPELPRCHVWGYSYNNKVYVGGGTSYDRQFVDLIQFDPDFE